MPAVMRAHPRPYLPSYVIPYLNAVGDLSGDRINTQHGINGIPFVSKLAYARWIGVHDEDSYIDMITVVDDVFVDATNKKIRKMVENNGRH